MSDDRRTGQKKQQDPDEHLEGFDIHINEFGEMTTNINIDQINSFLNTHLSDRKLNNTIEEEE